MLGDQCSPELCGLNDILLAVVTLNKAAFDIPVPYGRLTYNALAFGYPFFLPYDAIGPESVRGAKPARFVHKIQPLGNRFVWALICWSIV